MTNDEVLQALKEREIELENEVNHYRVMRSIEGDEKQEFRFGLLYAENKSALKGLRKVREEFEQLNNVIKDIGKALDEGDPEIVKLLIEYTKLKMKIKGEQ